MVKKVLVKCTVCSKEMLLLPCHAKTRKTCSFSCSGKKSSCKGQVAHNKGVPCSEEQKLAIKNTLKGKLIGNKSPAWKGGKMTLNNNIRGNSKYIDWRIYVFQRDNYTCQLCSKNGGNLEVHHKISFKRILIDNNIKSIEDALVCEQLWDITNGITLCKKCHSKIDPERKLKGAEPRNSIVADA